LYDEGRTVTTMYLITTVFVACSFAKVVVGSHVPEFLHVLLRNPQGPPSNGWSWSLRICNPMNVSENMTSAKLHWSINTLCSFLPIMIIDKTIGSSSWGITSLRSSSKKIKLVSGWLYSPALDFWCTAWPAPRWLDYQHHFLLL